VRVPHRKSECFSLKGEVIGELDVNEVLVMAYRELWGQLNVNDMIG